ncbi:hypothetical protein NDU88_009729 [Pleurodeles waltl]|uniref:Uncharacterized protein n=1 Tax=Pleurodeles waltl TaxID=8319 RepID=A0AAV7RYI2_PLEWA|nr:hypothetical protein NDU88_009729 [Pleurodeles waltl]
MQILSCRSGLLAARSHPLILAVEAWSGSLLWFRHQLQLLPSSVRRIWQPRGKLESQRTLDPSAGAGSLLPHGPTSVSVSRHDRGHGKEEGCGPELACCRRQLPWETEQSSPQDPGGLRACPGLPPPEEPCRPRSRTAAPDLVSVGSGTGDPGRPSGRLGASTSALPGHVVEVLPPRVQGS